MMVISLVVSLTGDCSAAVSSAMFSPTVASFAASGAAHTTPVKDRDSRQAAARIVCQTRLFMLSPSL